MGRLYAIVVTILGGIGLGTALMYFVGIGLALLPGWEDWAEFFMANAIYLLIIPYVSLVVHLVLRNHVGRFFLQRADFDEAVEYAGRRMKASVLRSKREAANQRLICARAKVGLGEYAQAHELLNGQHEKLPGSYAMEARRWQFELALREDDRQRAESLVVERLQDEKSARGELVAVLACEAELALRCDDLERYRDKVEAAMWKDADHPRPDLCRALAMLKYEDIDETSDEVIALLERVETPIAREIPARRAELTALRAVIANRRGRPEEARQLLEQAQQDPTDHWTKKIVDESCDSISHSG